MDGQFQAIQELGNDLSPCPIDMSEVQDMTTFGVISSITCNIQPLDLKRNEEQSLPETANAFFELYIEDANKNLVDVPVLIKGFRDVNGDKPNQSLNYESSRLVHRFFMYDTISGIEKDGGYKELKEPQYIRYASSVRLTVQMDPDKEERIRKPLLEIDYRTYKTDIITDLSVEVPASFYFDYYEEGAAFESSGEIIVYVFNAVVLLVVAVRMYYWIKMNPPRYVARHWGVSFGMKLLLVICDVWSNIMFTVYFAVTSYWFIMYKMQSNAYLLMP